MKSRKNYLKYRKNQFKWSLIGWWRTGFECPKCGEKNTTYFVEKYDTLCCISCNEWASKACGAPNCPFCSMRPSTPYEAYFLEDIGVGSAGGRKLWRRKNYQHKKAGEIRHKKRREKLFLS